VTSEDVQRIWKEARKEIMAECGLNKDKFSMAEIFGLRQLAQDLLEQQILNRPSKPKPPKHKKFVR